MKRSLLVLTAALVVAAPLALAAAEPLTVLPKPRFNAPAREPKPSNVRFVLVSPRPADPARTMETPPPVGLRIDEDLVTAPGRYRFDFRRFVWAPRIARGERPFSDAHPLFAVEIGGVLYVSTAHLTYARSTYGLNGYLNAIDVKKGKLRWRSAALVANSRNFVLVGDMIVTGYGFTAEPDYLYALDRRNGHVLARLLLPSAPDRIRRSGRTLTVDTYDHRVVVRIVGA